MRAASKSAIYSEGIGSTFIDGLAVGFDFDFIILPKQKCTKKDGKPITLSVKHFVMISDILVNNVIDA